MEPPHLNLRKNSPSPAHRRDKSFLISNLKSPQGLEESAPPASASAIEAIAR